MYLNIFIIYSTGCVLFYSTRNPSASSYTGSLTSGATTPIRSPSVSQVYNYIVHKCVSKRFNPRSINHVLTNSFAMSMSLFMHFHLAVTPLSSKV